jgi:predicted transcriptional regulator
MEPATIKKRLAALPNLSEFARQAEIPLRTLQRIVAGGSGGSVATLQKIEAALGKPPAPKPKRAKS